jgi:hypothetical protein
VEEDWKAATVPNELQLELGELENSVLAYRDPFEPVATDDWDADA